MSIEARLNEYLTMKFPSSKSRPIYKRLKNLRGSENLTVKLKNELNNLETRRAIAYKNIIKDYDDEIALLKGLLNED